MINHEKEFLEALKSVLETGHYVKWMFEQTDRKEYLNALIKGFQEFIDRFEYMKRKSSYIDDLYCD